MVIMVMNVTRCYGGYDDDNNISMTYIWRMMNMTRYHYSGYNDDDNIKMTNMMVINMTRYHFGGYNDGKNDEISLWRLR